MMPIRKTRDPAALALAARSRNGTTLTIKEIATTLSLKRIGQQLGLASWKYLSNLQRQAAPHPSQPDLTRAAPSTGGRSKKAMSYVQPSTFDMLAGASPASAMGGWAE
jgi:hypothetical protein